MLAGRWPLLVMAVMFIALAGLGAWRLWRYEQAERAGYEKLVPATPTALRPRGNLTDMFNT